MFLPLALEKPDSWHIFQLLFRGICAAAELLLLVLMYKLCLKHNEMDVDDVLRIQVRNKYI